jgi:hypothetical protein
VCFALAFLCGPWSSLLESKKPSHGVLDGVRQGLGQLAVRQIRYTVTSSSD